MGNGLVSLRRERNDVNVVRIRLPLSSQLWERLEKSGKVKEIWTQLPFRSCSDPYKSEGTWVLSPPVGGERASPKFEAQPERTTALGNPERWREGNYRNLLYAD